MNLPRAILLAALSIPFLAAQQPAEPCAGLPPGKHSLLERMTADYGLTCDQQLKIEPRLHDEESVTKPLLKFTSIPPDQQREIMNVIKVAARRGIRPLLTAEQQKQLDADIQQVSSQSKKGGKKQTAPPPPATFADEETLSAAISAYTPLTAEEKRTMLLQVKRAARADSSLQLTGDQQKKLDSEIQDLSKQ